MPLIAGTSGASSLRHVLRKLLSFPVALCSTLVVLSVATVRSRFSDPDMWWHLKTGEIIWTTHHIPTTDLFSYTTNHHAWVPHEWLSQVVMYGAYRWASYSGLMLWLFLLTALLLITSYILCSLYSGNPKTSLIGAMTVWFFATAGLAIRPQMIGYLFLAVELLLVHLGRTRSSRWFYCLPVLFVLWVNCHGSFFLGILVLAIFLFCSFFDFRMRSLVASRWDSNRRRTLTLALALSCAALLVNPDGIHQLLYPIQTMLHMPISLSVVDEWKPLQFGNARALGLLLTLGCILLIPIVRGSELLWHELILLALGTDLAINHRRMVFVFGVLAAPVISRLIAPLWDNYDPKRDRPSINAVFMLLSLALVFIAFPGRGNLTRQLNDDNPVKAVEFIQTHHLSGNMLNAYRYGGYLIWAAPEHPVFVDGRGDVFEWVGVLGEFARWAMLETNPNDLLNQWNISFCLLERNTPIAQAMLLLPGWKLVYSDNSAVIFVRSVHE